VRESNVFIALESSLSEKPIPDLLETLVAGRNGRSCCSRVSCAHGRSSPPLGGAESWLSSENKAGSLQLRYNGERDFGRENLQATLSKAFGISTFIVGRQTLNLGM